jgi:hypothetical protein
MNTTPERRSKPRILCDYPAIVEGYDEAGKRYIENARLANLSASGLYMKAKRTVTNGAELSVTILLAGEFSGADTPKIATNGIVVRTEPQVDGSCGIGVKFSKYKFL